VERSDCAAAVGETGDNDALDGTWDHDNGSDAWDGTGTHIVTVSVNGGPTPAFEVTAGDGTEGEGSYLAMGSSGTGGITGFDVDYFAFQPGGIPEPEPEPEPEPVTR